MANGQIIARAHNLCERLRLHGPCRDASLHLGVRVFGGKFLDKCTLYVTLEPCPILQAPLTGPELDESSTAPRTTNEATPNSTVTVLHPKTKCEGGLLAEEAAALLTNLGTTRFPHRGIPLPLRHARIDQRLPRRTSSQH